MLVASVSGPCNLHGHHPSSMTYKTYTIVIPLLYKVDYVIVPFVGVFKNIAATSEELELIKLPEKRDYEMEERGDSALHRRNLPFIPENSGVVKNKPDQAILWEVQRLRTAIANV